MFLSPTATNIIAQRESLGEQVGFPVAEGDEQTNFDDVRRLQRLVDSFIKSYGFGATPAP